MSMIPEQLKPIIECAILASGEPLTMERLRDLFAEMPSEERPSTTALREAIALLAESCAERGFELKEVASGFCFQAKIEFTPWVKRLWQTRPQRYTRALLETLAVVAYRQPVTRGEIEQIRGVNVSSNTIKTLLDHEWIRVLGQREVPGRPSIYGTTRQFLDNFNLKSLDELPVIGDTQDPQEVAQQLESNLEITVEASTEVAAETEEVVLSIPVEEVQEQEINQEVNQAA